MHRPHYDAYVGLSLNAGRAGALHALHVAEGIGAALGKPGEAIFDAMADDDTDVPLLMDIWKSQQREAKVLERFGMA